MTDTERLDLYELACAADSGIKALDRMVTAICAAAWNSAGPVCSGCVWSQIIKPLAKPLIGWERGYPKSEAKEPGKSWQMVNVADLLKQMEKSESRRTPATTDTERWLRTSEAWDLITGTWLARLEEADPGTGHGIVFEYDDTPQSKPEPARTWKRGELDDLVHELLAVRPVIAFHEIARTVGCSISTAQRVVGRLRTSGLIQVESGQHGAPGSSQSVPNRYRVANRPSGAQHRP